MTKKETIEEIKKWIDEKDEYVVKAIRIMYRRCSYEELTGFRNNTNDGKGFSHFDSEFGMSLGSQIEQGKQLTPRQIESGRKMIRKYAAQIYEHVQEYGKELPPNPLDNATTGWVGTTTTNRYYINGHT